MSSKLRTHIEGIPSDILASIGQVTLQWAALEDTLQRIYWRLENIENPYDGYMKTMRWSWARVLKECESLLNNSETPRVNQDIIQQLFLHQDEIRQLSKQRNDYVHGIVHVLENPDPGLSLEEGRKALQNRINISAPTNINEVIIIRPNESSGRLEYFKLNKDELNNLSYEIAKIQERCRHILSNHSKLMRRSTG